MLCPSPNCQIRVRVRVITSKSESESKSKSESSSPSKKKIQVRVTSPVVHIFDISLSSKTWKQTKYISLPHYFNKLPILQMNPLNRFIIFFVFIGHKFQNTCILNALIPSTERMKINVVIISTSDLKRKETCLDSGVTRPEPQVTISESESESESESK